MHELHTARKVLAMARKRAQAQGHSTLSRISVRIGAWSGIDTDHLKHDFADLAPGIDLEIEVIQPSAHCQECGAIFQAGKPSLACSKCGSRRVKLDQTREIELLSIS